MPEFQATRFIRFNEQLLAISKIGLPLNLEIPRDQLQQELGEQIAEATRIPKHCSVEQAALDLGLTPKHQAAFNAYLGTDNPAVVFNSVVQSANAEKKIGTQISHAFLHPVIVLVVAYLGFVHFCFYLYPKLQAFYTATSLEQPPWMQCLTAIQNSLPVWGPLVPILLILACFFGVRLLRGGNWAWIPGAKQYAQMQNQSRLAEQAAVLVENGASANDAIGLLTGASIDNTKPSVHHSVFDWVLDQHSDANSKPAVLRMFSRMYRDVADRNWLKCRNVFPTILGLLIGGLVALVYSVSLFVPMSGLLQDICVSVGGF